MWTEGKMMLTFFWPSWLQPAKAWTQSNPFKNTLILKTFSILLFGETLLWARSLVFLPAASNKSFLPPVFDLVVKQEGRGQGTTFKRNIAIGHDKNWLEPTRSKVAEDSTSSGPWATFYAHCNTLALWWIWIRDLQKIPDGRDWLWEKLGLVLMGGVMLSKSLIQFSGDGQGCVPSQLFGFRPNYGRDNEGNGNSFKRICTRTVVFSAPDPTAGHYWPTPLLETPGHSQPCLTQWNYEPCRGRPPKMNGSWWGVTTKRGALEKEKVNHFSICAMRTPWTVWKGRKIWHWKMSSPGQ